MHFLIKFCSSSNGQSFCYTFVFDLGGILTSLPSSDSLLPIPAYLDLAAGTNTTQEDDQSWLSYWVVISTFSLVELPLDKLNFLPCYNTIKLVFVLWCLLPGPASGNNIIFQMVRT